MKLVLPVPPLGYKAEDMRIRDALLVNHLETKTDKNELQTFLGVPYVLASSANAAFSATNGATVKFPFDTQLANADVATLVLGSNAVTPAFTTGVELNYNLFHAAGGVTIDVNFTVGVYVNGVLINTHVQKKGFNDNFNLMGTFVLVAVPKNQSVDLRVSHDYTSPVLFNGTKSTMYFKRLSYNPIYNRSRL